MKLVSVDETKGWQYTKDGERIMLELPQEKKLVDPDVFMKKSGGKFTGEVKFNEVDGNCINFDNGIYINKKNGSTLLGTNSINAWVGTPDTALTMRGNATRPTYNNNPLALLSDILDKTYPKGAIYLSVNKTPSPAELFGGSWQILNGGRTLWTTDYLDSEGADLPIEAGLPDITGYIHSIVAAATWDNQPSWGGAFTLGKNVLDIQSPQRDGYRRYLKPMDFAASKSNSIYGSSETVQPPAIKVYAWKRIL